MRLTFTNLLLLSLFFVCTAFFSVQKASAQTFLNTKVTLKVDDVPDPGNTNVTVGTVVSTQINYNSGDVLFAFDPQNFIINVTFGTHTIPQGKKFELVFTGGDLKEFSDLVINSGNYSSYLDLGVAFSNKTFTFTAINALNTTVGQNGQFLLYEFTASASTPAITSSTYDALSGTLVVTGTDFTNRIGGDDIDLSFLTIKGDGGGTHTLTSGFATSDNATQFSVTLNTSDKDAVNLILNKNGTQAADGVTNYKLTAAAGWLVDIPSATSLTGTAIDVSSVVGLAITSAAYDANTGALVVTGTGFLSKAGAANDIDATKFTFKGETEIATAQRTYTLTSNTPNAEITSSTSFTIMLGSADKDAVNRIMNRNLTLSSGGRPYNLAANEDWAKGAGAAITDANPTISITVSNVGTPTILSSTYNASTGELVVTGSRFLSSSDFGNDIVLTQFTFTGEGGATYTLTTPSAPISSTTSFAVSLNETDINALALLLNKDGAASEGGTTYNLAAAEDWAAGAAYDVTDAAATNIVLATNVRTITVAGSLAAVNTTYGTASVTPTSFTVSGNNMLTRITVTPPPGFQVSKTAGGTSGYAASGTAITVGSGSGGTIASTTVYVRLAATAAFGTYSGTVVCTSTNALTKSITTTSSNVSKKALSITADNAGRTYYGSLLTGGSSSAFTSSGLANAETIGSVTIAYTPGAGNGNTLTDPAGSYPAKITASAATGGTFTAGNYTISYVPGDITVNAAPLTVTTNTANKTYGVTLTGGAGSTAFTATGLKNTETVGTVTIAYASDGGNGNTTTDPVGIYTGKITASALTGGTFTAGNYVINYVPGNIVIDPATLTITAANQGKMFNTPAVLGSSAFTPTGLQNGETIGAVTLTSTGTAVTAAVGSYPITPSGATGGTFTAGNYTIGYVSGTLQVTPSTNANLSSIIISSGTLSPSYTSATTSYTVAVGNLFDTFTVTPTVDVPGTTVKVNGAPVTSGAASGAIPLNVGSNSIPVTVTAQDGITIKTYTINVTRAAAATQASNPNLASLALSSGTLSPAFAATTTAYTVILPDNISTVTLTPTASEISSTIHVGALTVVNGTSSAVALPDDITITYIDVFAGDGTHKTYTLTFVKPRTMWKGVITNVWSNAANWTNGVPDATKLAVIGSVITPPVITGNESVTNITINSGGSLGVTGTLQIAGNITNNGVIVGTGTVVFNSGLKQTISGNGAYNNMTINNTNGVSITAGSGNTTSIAGILTMSEGTLTTNDNLLLRSDANATASVAPVASGASIAGQVTVQRWIAGQRGFRALGHPFNRALPLSQLSDNFSVSGSGAGFASGLGYSGSSVAYFDSVALLPALFQKPLTNAPNTTADLVWSVNRGILVMVRGQGTEGLGGYTNNQPSAFAADATGVLNQGTLSDYVLGTNATNSSYNLVGNPYAAPVNIKLLKSNGGAALSANNGSAGVANTIYVFNPFKNAGITAMPAQEERGGYDTYTDDGSTDIIIPSFGAFFVQAKGAGNVIRFAENAKTVSSNPLAVMGKGGAAANLTLTIGNKRGSWDDIKLRWDDKAGATGTDNYDGSKMNNQLLDFYSISSDQRRLCIDSRSDSFNREEIIPLGIATHVEDAFMIKVSAYNMPSDVRVYLRDKLMGTETLLGKVEDGYAFSLTSDDATKGDHRFELALRFAAVTIPITPDASVSGDVKFSPNPFKDELSIHLGAAAVSATGIIRVRLMSMNGTVIKTADAAPGTSIIKMRTPDLAPGVYLVEVTHGGVRTIKQVIKQ